MEILYQRELNRNYMILPLSGQEENYEQKMLLDNSIAGLLPVSIRKVNGNAYYYYDIHSKQSIQTIFEHKLFDRETLIQLFRGIMKVWEELHHYLLSPENLFLKPECVYMNLETGETSFCFYPEERVGKETFEELAEFLIDRVNHGEDDAKVLAYAYYEKVCTGEYNPKELIDQVMEEEIKENPIEEWKYEEKEDDKEMFYFVEPEEKETEEELKYSVLTVAACLILILVSSAVYLVILLHPGLLPFIGLSKENYIIVGVVTAICSAVGMMGIVRFFGQRKDREGREKDRKEEKSEKEYHSDDIEEEIEEQEEHFGETTVLSVEKMWKTPVLKGMDGEEERKFFVDENPFIIGKLSGKANGILTDSRVSRVHAAIREDSGQYYISDLNSTNGTYVNGKRLDSSETVLLCHMDKIRLASVEMTFLCQ